jgi:AGCS family alanine or glycine:cation symporter
MATKFAEATLAVRFSTINDRGERLGGPMYMIEKGLGHRFRFLATMYAFFGVVAAFGVGNATQINALIGGINSVIMAFGGLQSKRLDVILGICLAFLIMGMLLGGAKRIGQIAERLVPFASIAYLLLGVGVLIVRHRAIPNAFSAIFLGAFSPQAVTGGVLGSAFIALRIGISRGTFTNEAGMGTAAIAHGAAEVRHPAEQGLMGIVEVFLDTIVICTMTALVILCSGVSVEYGVDQGILLTNRAFCAIYGSWVTVPIAIAICCFALATVLGWGLYGARCAQYLFGSKVWRPFVYLQAVIVVLGAVLKTGVVWLLSETVNGLMAIPNLLALAMLSPELARLTKDFTNWRKAKGGAYETIKNCKQVAGISNPEVPSVGGKGKGRWKEDLSFEHRSA